MLRFDTTFNVGHAISIFGIIVGAAALIGGWYVMDYRLGQVELNVREMRADIRQVIELNVRVAEHGRRIEYLERMR